MNSKLREFFYQGARDLGGPFFFYDLDFLAEHLQALAAHQGEGLELWYACKANPLSAVLRVFREAGLGVDVASTGELDQVLAAGFAPERLLATGPAKGWGYLKNLLEKGVDVVVLESLNQALWLNQAAGELKKRPRVLLRVQLDWDSGESVLGGNEITPFGLDPGEWLKLQPGDFPHLRFLGFHVFQWGNILDLDRLEGIWNQTAGVLTGLASQMKIPLEVVDLGGGLGIPYQNENRRLDFQEVKKRLMKLKAGRGLDRIWMELGRWAVGECGWYLAPVVDRKKVRGREILVLEGGINHLARPALTGQAFPCGLLRDSGEEPEEFFVHGPLCTALDKLGKFSLPGDVKPGDWLVFSQAGAYGFTESMPFFLCHALPGEAAARGGRMEILRPGKNPADWLV